MGRRRLPAAHKATAKLGASAGQKIVALSTEGLMKIDGQSYICGDRSYERNESDNHNR